MKLYCSDCSLDLSIHADGTVACGCGDLWRRGDKVPAGWVDNFGDPVEAESLENWAEFEEIGQ